MQPSPQSIMRYATCKRGWRSLIKVKTLSYYYNTTFLSVKVIGFSKRLRGTVGDDTGVDHLLPFCYPCPLQQHLHTPILTSSHLSSHLSFCPQQCESGRSSSVTLFSFCMYISSSLIVLAEKSRNKQCIGVLSP